MGDSSGLDVRRGELQARGLDDVDLDDDPLVQFGRWFDVCVDAGVHEPEAMIVSTVAPGGRPSSRHVLLRGLDHGLVFFTNRTSQKGRELTVNPVAAVCFPWNVLARQVRVVGSVEVVADTESDEYFASRPRGSQIGAWASRQSQPISGRAALEQWVFDAEERFAGKDVSRPPFWGGYRIVPDEVEFWQGRPSRLHDRFRYSRVGDVWHRERLSP